MASAHFSLSYGWNNRPFLSLQRYAAGHESVPFQARVLVAWIFRIFANKAITIALAAHMPYPLRDPYLLVQLAVNFLALFGAIAFTRGSISSLTGDKNFSRWAAFLVAYMAYFNLVLLYGLSYTLPYDLSSLFFFAGCLYFILRRSWLWFYPFFILGTFNRETICFVMVFYVIWALSSMPSNPKQETKNAVRMMVILHCCAQLVLWTGIKIYLHHIFSGNPHENGGRGIFVPHLAYNLREIMKPQQWPLLLSNFGFMLPVLISQRAWIGNKGIARACAIILPLWLALMFYVGVIVEIRIFTELIALVSIAIALIVFHRWVQPAAELADKDYARPT
jgi:hypothetical protein